MGEVTRHDLAEYNRRFATLVAAQEEAQLAAFGDGGLAEGDEGGSAQREALLESPALSEAISEAWDMNPLARAGAVPGKGGLATPFLGRCVKALRPGNLLK